MEMYTGSSLQSLEVIEMQPKSKSRESDTRGIATSTALDGRQYGIEGLDDEIETNGVSELSSTSHHDQRDMQRLGKKQEMRRTFRGMSIFSFAVVVQATWEFVLVSLTPGLSDGGLPNLVWSFVWVMIGFLPIVASLAEMVSMSPTSGGQYHWVSEFAPANCQKFLSYFSGWMGTLAWQAGNATGAFCTSSIIQALIFTNDNNYQSPAWQGTLLVICNSLILLAFNVWGVRWIPYAQNGLLLCHIYAFLAIIIPLWILAPHATTQQVFTGFTNSGGWSSTGLSILVGQITAIWGCIGSDAVAHMSEETKDASIVVPMAMMWGYILNACMGLVLIVTVSYALPDLDAALNDVSDLPFLYIFRSIFDDAWTTVAMTATLLLIVASNVSYMASTARETFALARDRGLPYASWIGKVHSTYHIPVNALCLSSAISILLSLINIGSSTAFDAIISLNTSALMLTYTISIGCVLWRRLFYPSTLPPARWSLGRYGLPINVVGVSFAAWVCFWSFWPTYAALDPSDFNWSSVMFIGVTVLCLSVYWFQGRYVYEGPAALVRAAKD